MFSLWNATRDKIGSFNSKANGFYSTIKFMAEMSETKCAKATDLQGSRFLTCKHTIKRQRPFNTQILTCHPPGVTKGFIRGEASDPGFYEQILLALFDENRNFKIRLKNRRYAENMLERHLSELNFKEQKKSLKFKSNDAHSRMLPFVT